MAKRVRDTSAREKRVRDRGARERRMEPADLGKALGAQPVGDVESRALPSVSGLYRELSERLRSTGGRPGLEGATRRQKIPLTDADWSELERLSRELDVAPGQVASVLLHQVLSSLDVEKAAALLRKRRASG